MVEIIDKFIRGKRPDQSLCEDGIFVNENFVAVIDGASSKGNKKWQGKYTSGGYAKEIIKQQLSVMPRDIDRDSFFLRLDKALLDAYREEMDTDEMTDYLRAILLVYSDHHRQLWAIGDCKALINGAAFQDEKIGIDEIMAGLRAFVINHYLVSGGKEEDLYTNDVGREAIMPFLKMQCIFENLADNDFGYSTINGHGVELSQIRTIPVSVGDVIVMSSDGYPVLYDTVEKCEAELAKLINEDPLCYKKLRCTKGIQQGFSSFDDRCFLKFRIGE